MIKQNTQPALPTQGLTNEWYLADTAGMRVTTLCQPLHFSRILVVNDVQVMLQGRVFCALKIHQFFGFVYIDLSKTKQHIPQY